MDKMQIARKAYRLLANVRKIFTAFSSIGFSADFECPVEAIDDIAMEMLQETFPEVDSVFFEYFFYNVAELQSEDEFIARLADEIKEAMPQNEYTKINNAAKMAVDKCKCGNCSCHEKNYDNTKNKQVIRVKTSVSQAEIDEALRKLFGFDWFRA